MTKIVRVENCRQCPLHSWYALGRKGDGERRHLCLHEGTYHAYVPDPEQIPEWCPLEDAEGVAVASEGEQ
jgi:hypothetical protein